jgi:hypothetical protein
MILTEPEKEEKRKNGALSQSHSEKDYEPEEHELG